MVALHLSRRAALAGTVLAAAGVALPGGARAAAPASGRQAPAFYRFKVGEFEGTVVSDGPLALGPPADAFKGAPKEELEKDLRDNFLPTGDVVLEQNALVLNTGRQLLLFDTGMGAYKLFGPTTGRLLTNLRAAGIEPEQIDGVVITHAHSDHCFGLVGEDGKPTFPNAQVFLTKSDYEFWTDEAKLNTPFKAFIDGARRNLKPLHERTTWVEAGKEVLPGVSAIATPGHTVGHTSYAIASGRESLLFSGDICHHQVLLLRRPRLEFAYDTDPAQAVQSRLRTLDMAAADRMPILSYHFPFPGIGHVAKAGEGYAWYPTPMKTLL